MKPVLINLLKSILFGFAVYLMILGAIASNLFWGIPIISEILQAADPRSIVIWSIASGILYFVVKSTEKAWQVTAIVVFVLLFAGWAIYFIPSFSAFAGRLWSAVMSVF